MHSCASLSSPCRHGRREAPTGHLETRNPALSPGRPRYIPTDPLEPTHPTKILHRGRSPHTDAAVVLGRLPPWSKPPEALEDPSTCPTCPLEHYDAHVHHRPGLCRCTRATPARRLCSSRRSPWPAPWEALAATLIPPSQSSRREESFPLLNWTPTPPRGLTSELAAGESTAAGETEDFSPRRPHTREPVVHGPSQRREG